MFCGSQVREILTRPHRGTFDNILETFLVVTTGVHVLLASSGWGPGTALNNLPRGEQAHRGERPSPHVGRVEGGQPRLT